jgi:hypothetical protein
MKLRREGDIGSRVGVRLVRARQVSYTRVSSLGVALVGRVCLGCVVCGEETVADRTLDHGGLWTRLLLPQLL